MMKRKNKKKTRKGFVGTSRDEVKKRRKNGVSFVIS